MGFRSLIKRLVCLAALLCLCSCSLMESLPASLQASPAADSSGLPDLRQLHMPAAAGADEKAQAANAAGKALQVDLWLDASQVMGGINPDPDSLYPHRSVRYREGGFHYRYENQVGWYENLLRDLLSAAEGRRVRVLRSGNERITDDLLLQTGLCGDGSPEKLRSLRRDLLTYAIDPMPTVFSGFSAEKMDDSFYSLYSPQMNRMAQFAQSGGRGLENPGHVEEMSLFLDSLIASYDPRSWQETLSGLLSDDFSPLMQALENLDHSRLSVITCDPLTLRRLTGTTDSGSPVDYVEQLVRQTGLFDQGLTVGLYAMQLDYMGQIHTISAADLSQPLIWGRLDYISYKNKIEGPLPMPRTLLMLVVGAPDQVAGYTAALDQRLDSNAALKGLRGPDAGQLTYSMGGETVTQQPFSFTRQYTEISRHSVDSYTAATEGCQISVTKGEGGLLTGLSQPTAGLAAGQSGQCEITVSWPVMALEGGLSLAADQLPRLHLVPDATLLLTGTQPIGETDVPAGTQALALRDTRYLFTYTGEDITLPFTPGRLRLSEDGTTLTATFTCNAADLTPGYYRFTLAADITGSQLSWPAIDWLDDVSVTVTNEQIAAWQLMADALGDFSRYSDNVPSQFWHAWGDTSGKYYREALIPDCPPVYAAPHLRELITQLQNAAKIDSLPFVRLQLDVFVAPAEQLGL